MCYCAMWYYILIYATVIDSSLIHKNQCISNTIMIMSEPGVSDNNSDSTKITQILPFTWLALYKSCLFSMSSFKDHLPGETTQFSCHFTLVSQWHWKSIAIHISMAWCRTVVCSSIAYALQHCLRTGDIKNNAWVTVNNDFWVTSEAICQWFSRVTKSQVKIIGKSHREWPKNRYSR